jgi:hypothetical protein
MRKCVDDPYRIRRVLRHATWREAGVEYCIGIADKGPLERTVRCVAPKLVLFRRAEGTVKALDAVATYRPKELEGAWSGVGGPTAFPALIAPDDAQAAVLACIRYFIPSRPGAMKYDLTIWRREQARLVRRLELPSRGWPWMGDLDEDGDVEIVTWPLKPIDGGLGTGVRWPIIRTLVDGEYQARSAQFTDLFAAMASFYERLEQGRPLDAKLPRRVAEAHEVVGDWDRAIAAYGRAERKHYATADRMEKKGYTEQARLHREAAVGMRERRTQLEAEVTASPQGD